jgi:hypothetical protein
MKSFYGRFLGASLGMLLSLGSSTLLAQDDLLAELESSQEKPVVEGLFNSYWLTNLPTTNTVGHRDLVLSFMHRFGPVGGSLGGVQSLFGLDNILDYRLAAYYGITERWHVGVGRSKASQRFDFTSAYRILDQRQGGFPFAATLHAYAAYASEVGGSVSVTPYFFNGGFVSQVDRYPSLESRWTYTVQLALARKFGRNFSLLLVPSMLHRNYRITPRDENTLFALGIGTRLRLNNTITLTADYVQTASPYRYLRLPGSNYFAPLSVGFEVNVGGHVFQMFMSNSAVMPMEHLLNSPNRWDRGQMGFGFNIVRVIGLKHKERRPEPVPAKESSEPSGS